MAEMDRRVSIALVVLAVVVLEAEPARAQSPSILAQYSFDDSSVETGPDTFAIFQNAKGSVRLSSSDHFSGYRSIEIRDVSGDKDFPELQGYFPLRSHGTIYLHFALMITNPVEELNIALAGPEGFAPRRNGIGFWLKTLDGYLCQYSDSMPKKLFLPQPFAWYVVDAAYDIDRGSYDLTIHQNGLAKPVVSLRDQANAAKQPGSSVDKFSFIGDPGTDQSNVVYYVDDVVVSVDEAVPVSRFAAPGRKKFFVDYWDEHQRTLLGRPRPIPAMDFSDFGFLPADIESLKNAGLWDALQRRLAGQPVPVPEGASAEHRQLFEAAALWMDGTAALNSGDAAIALERFESASRLAPGGKIYELNAILSLAALNEWPQVDRRLSGIYGDWANDIRFPAALAMIGIARKNLSQAEEWLHVPAEEVPDVLGQQLLDRLRRNQIDASLLADLRSRFPDNWQDYVRDKLLADQYFYVLLWQKQTAAASQFAGRMVGRYRMLGIEPSSWLEKMGDVAFMQADFSEALRRYAEIPGAGQGHEEPRILQKMSDVYFRLGDLDNERLYRERVYGRLSGGY
jgi:tetratricopeptide (TPR) repeat protein